MGGEIDICRPGLSVVREVKTGVLIHPDDNNSTLIYQRPSFRIFRREGKIDLEASTISIPSSRAVYWRGIGPGEVETYSHRSQEWATRRETLEQGGSHHLVVRRLQPRNKPKIGIGNSSGSNEWPL